MIQQNITIFVEVEGRTGVFSWCVIKSFHLPRNVILNDASIFQPREPWQRPPCTTLEVDYTIYTIPENQSLLKQQQ